MGINPNAIPAAIPIQKNANMNIKIAKGSISVPNSLKECMPKPIRKTASANRIINPNTIKNI